MICICITTWVAAGHPTVNQRGCADLRGRARCQLHQKRRTGSVSLLTGRPGHIHGQLASCWLEKKNEQGGRMGSTMMHACPSDRRRNDACPFSSPSPSFTLSLFHSFTLSLFHSFTLSPLSPLALAIVCVHAVSKRKPGMRTPAAQKEYIVTKAGCSPIRPLT